MSEVMDSVEQNNIDNALIEFKKSISKKYTKEELVDRIISQFESTKIAISILTILTNDGATGSDRALAREQGKEIVRIYNELNNE